MGFGISEALLIFGALTLLFGGKKIPELATGIGRAVRELKKSVNEEDPVETESAHAEREDNAKNKQEPGGSK